MAAPSCACPFCATTPCAAKLPLPLRMETPDGTAAHWAWLTKLEGGNLELAAVTPQGVRRTFSSAVVATRALCPEWYATRKEVLERWRTTLRDGGSVSLADLHAYVKGRGGRAPSLWAPTSSCHATSSCSAPPTTTALEQVPQKKKKKQKREEEEEDMERVPHAPPLGGDAVEVARILEARPQWDQETVEELMRWGATPRLLKVTQIVQKPSHRMARCTFVQPNGRLVPDIWVPYGVLRIDYASAVARFEDEEEK